MTDTAAATSATSDDDDDEFVDAQEENSSVTSKEENSFVLKIPKGKHSSVNTSSSSSSTVTGSRVHLTVANSRATDLDSGSSDDEGQSESDQVLVVAEKSQEPDMEDVTDRSLVPAAGAGDVRKALRQRRMRVPDKPNYPLNLWSIMKNCIGKELSKIPMPVNFNEPLSMLQRLTEDYEYSELLDSAAKCTDVCEQLAYVAAFTISSYSTTSNRTGKPFNPLLGETYECDRTDDFGWRVIAEQVTCSNCWFLQIRYKLTFISGVPSSPDGSHPLRGSWLGVLAGVHDDHEVPGQVPASGSVGDRSRRIYRDGQSVLLAQSDNDRPQYNCGQTLGG